MIEVVEEFLTCPEPPISFLDAASASMSVSIPCKTLAFSSSRGTFHVAISSSSMGEMPLGNRCRRRRRVLTQRMIPATIKTNPTAERTVLRAITSVLLLAIPDSAPSCGGGGGGVVVALDVVEMAVEVKVPVGIVSVSRISRDQGSVDKVRDVKGSLEAETTTGYILEGKGPVEVGPGAVDVSTAVAVFFPA